MMPPGYRHETLREISSTNDEARRRAEAGEPGNLWLRAVRQTKGRGRRDRTWQSAEGDLMCSLLLRPGCSMARSGELSFVAALATFDALSEFTPASSLSLKWPNDILLNGHKTAGILLESAADRSGLVDWLTIGIGVNLVNYPEDVEFPATSLKAQGNTVPSADEVLAVMAAVMAGWLNRWQAQGFAPVRETWLKRAQGLGQTITVRLPEESFEGRFETINEAGAIEVSLADGTLRAILAGDVFYSPPQK